MQPTGPSVKSTNRFGGENTFKKKEKAIAKQPIVSAGAIVSVVPDSENAQAKTSLVSRQILEEHRSVGTGNAKSSRELWNFTLSVCTRMVLDLDEIRKKNQIILQNTYNAIEEIRKKYSDYAIKKFEAIAAGHTTSQADVNDFQFLSMLSKSVSERSVESTEQYFRLQEASQKNVFGGYGKAIDLLYSKRVEEIAQLGQMLSLVQQQEEHEKILTIAYQDQQLKKESQYYEKALEMAHLNLQIDEKAHDAALKRKAQSNQQETNLYELALKKYAVQSEVALRIQQASQVTLNTDTTNIEEVKNQLTTTTRMKILEGMLEIGGKV